MRKWLAIGVPSALAVGLVGFYYASRPGDDALIKQALDEAVAASKQGRPNPVLDALSTKFTYQGLSADRGEIAKVVREARPEVTVLSPKPEITGDKAKIRSDVALKFDWMGMSLDKVVKGVEIDFAREPAIDFAVLPTSHWRITSVTGPDLPEGE